MAINTLNQALCIPDGKGNIFQANRNRYAIFITLTDPLRGTTVAVPMTSTESVEWVNELNRFCLTGEIVVNDSDGLLGNLIGAQNIRCDIVFGRFQPDEPLMTTSRDPGFGPTLARVELQKMQEIFEHSFLVRNFEIVDKIDQVIKYKIQLISTNYLGCIRQIQYSNYNQNQGSDVFEILRDVVGVAFDGIVNPEKFELDMGIGKSGVKLYWCTDPNDTIITAGSKLLNLLFTSSKIQLNGGGRNEEITEQCAAVQDPGGFFIPYIVTIPYIKELTEKPGYKLVDFNKSFTTKRSASGGTVILLDGAGFEQLVRSNMQRLGSVTAEKNTESLKKFQAYNYWFYNAAAGMMDPQICYANDIIDLWQDKQVPQDTDLTKINADQFDEIFGLAGVGAKPELATGHLRRFGPSTDFDLHVYSDLASLFLYGDSIVFEKDGNLADLPGNNIAIADENSPELKNEARDVINAKRKEQSNNQFIGEYNIVRTRHIIKPNVGSFTENLLLARKATRPWQH